MDPGGAEAHWREAAAYAPLLRADRAAFAWEWLRRDPAYRAAATWAIEAGGRAATARDPATWGLHAFEAPGLAAPFARPVWRRERYPWVLQVFAEAPAAPSDAVDLLATSSMPAMVVGPDGREHLLISDGFRFIRLDVLEGTVRRGAVQLRYLLSGLASAEKPLLSLRRLLTFWRTGRFSSRLHLTDPRARRLVLLLRAHDAVAAGAGQREIAAELISPDAGGPRWRIREPTLRSRAQRLVRSARAMADGGHFTLLR